jgi:hypothetical protein
VVKKLHSNAVTLTKQTNSSNGPCRDTLFGEAIIPVLFLFQGLQELGGGFWQPDIDMIC